MMELDSFRVSLSWIGGPSVLQSNMQPLSQASNEKTLIIATANLRVTFFQKFPPVPPGYLNAKM